MRLIFVLFALSLTGCGTILVKDCKPHHMTLDGKLVQDCVKAE